MGQFLKSQFHDTTSALAYAIAGARARSGRPELQPPYNELTQFVLEQHARMPDYLRAPLLAATLGFDLLGLLRSGHRFHCLPPEARLLHIEAWKQSKLGFKRDLIRYHESLVTLALYSRAPEKAPPKPPAASKTISSAQVISSPKPALRHAIVVVGSGPGGAITACLLAEAGRDVLLIEEGDFLALDSCTPFTVDEMVQKYRHGGQTVAMGATKVAYVEGRCVGGGSEINSGLYHRTPPDILKKWRDEFRVASLSEDDLRPHFEACERDVSVSLLPGAAPAASLKLHEGATRLGWKLLEVPRWFSHTGGSSGGKRQSMTETFVPRFLRAGGHLLPQTRVDRIRQENGRWTISARHAATGAVGIEADTLFICGGAVQTPALLRRSGITKNIGDSLRLHPTVKVVAQFPEAVNSATMGVPVHQVKEFSPRLSFGCSISNPPYLALGLLEHPHPSRELSEAWPQLATYYAMITGEGRGTVRTLPGFRDPLVRYRLTEGDRRDLADGLRKLSHALFEAGATTLFPGITRGPKLAGPDELSRIPAAVPAGLTALMTIHLFSSCPMGEDTARCATDSFGRVHGFKNLFVADASLLCTAPGVNPQGSIMALARRNVLTFLAGNLDPVTRIPLAAPGMKPDNLRWPAFCLLALILLALGVVIVPANYNALWGDPSFTDWITPIANQLDGHARLYEPGLHSPLPPLPFVIVRLLHPRGAVWFDANLLNYAFQSGMILLSFCAFVRQLGTGVTFAAALAVIPVYFGMPKTILYDSMAQFLVAACGIAAVWFVQSADDNAARPIRWRAHLDPANERPFSPSPREARAGRGESQEHSTHHSVAPLPNPLPTPPSWGEGTAPPSFMAAVSKRTLHWLPLAVLGLLLALLLLTKQNCGAGALLGAGLTLFFLPRAANFPRRCSHLVLVVLFTVLFFCVIGLALNHFLSFSGMIRDVILTGSDPKGGGAHLVKCLVVFFGQMGIMMIGVYLLLVIFNACAGAGFPAWPALIAGISSDAPADATRNPGQIKLPGAALAGSALGLALALLAAKTGISLKNTLMENAWGTLVLNLGIGLNLLIAAVVALPLPAPRGRDLGDHPLAACVFIFIFGALFHNLSTSSLYWTHANNPLLFSALALVLGAGAKGSGTSGKNAAVRRQPLLLPILVAFILFSVWPFANDVTADVLRCTQSWPEIKHLAGARMRPESANLRVLVKTVDSLANSDETVLLLPGDPNVEAWFERKRPNLSSAIIFTDQYWDRFVDQDFAELQAHPPKVIVIGPRRFWRPFSEALHPHRGAERLIDLVQDRLLPQGYDLHEAQAIGYQGGTDFMDVYVRRSPY